MLLTNFFNQHACDLAKALLGKVLYAKYKNRWLAARIIETEAYCLEDKASHASLGYTEKRKALFMPPGTIYMYYARGGDSLNISAQGPGSAVLIKSGFPYIEDNQSDADMITTMQRLNPPKNISGVRPLEKLCAGQTLLCKSLHLHVSEWDQQQFDAKKFFIAEVNETPEDIIQTTRLGIPKGRDEQLPYRFIDARFAAYCTAKPTKKQRNDSPKQTRRKAKTLHRKSDCRL